MATYRCPECGASHKDLVSHCRLCGAPIENPITVRNVAVDRSVAAERFAPKRLTHFIWIGLAVVVVVVGGALITGAVESPTLERRARQLPLVPDGIEDAWFTWADPQERLIVDVPNLPAEADGPQLGADTSVWETTLGDRQMFIGYTDGLDFEAGELTEESDTTAAFRDAAEAIADQQDGNVSQVGDLFRQDGSWASNVLIDGLSLADGVAWGSIRMVMSDGEIYFVETIDYQRNTDPQDRMRDSMIVTADVPDATIPTLPQEVREDLEGSGDDS
jgi:hypothetical protein